MGVFGYAFMQRASIVGILSAATTPCAGLVIVCKRLSVIGDTLSYTLLAEIAAGLPLGLNSILTVAVVYVVAATGVEVIHRKVPRFPGMSIAIIISTGIGLAGVLSELIRNATNFNSLLFRSIVAISSGELYLVIAVSMIIPLMFLLIYKELFYVSLDEQSIRLVGVPVEAVDSLFTVLIAVTVPVTARTMGALIILSMVIVPVTYAMQFGTSCRQALILVVILDILFVITDLFAVYCLGLKPSGMIVLIEVLVLILVFVEKRTLR